MTKFICPSQAGPVFRHDPHCYAQCYFPSLWTENSAGKI